MFIFRTNHLSPNTGIESPQYLTINNIAGNQMDVAFAKTDEDIGSLKHLFAEKQKYLFGSEVEIQTNMLGVLTIALNLILPQMLNGLKVK